MINIVCIYKLYCNNKDIISYLSCFQLMIPYSTPRLNLLLSQDIKTIIVQYNNFHYTDPQNQHVKFQTTKTYFILFFKNKLCWCLKFVLKIQNIKKKT